MKRDPGNTFKTAQSITIGSKVRTFVDVVNSKDKFDIYRFRLNSSSTVNGFLTGLKAKTNLTLYDKAGNLIKRSATSLNSRRLNAVLDPGVYYIAVTQIAGATAYQLNLSAIAQTVTPPLPPPPPPLSNIDLMGDRLSVFPSGFIGKSVFSDARNFNLDYSIKNLGNSGIQEFLVSFYLSNNNSISTSDYLLDTYRISNLSAFSTTPTFRANLNLPQAGDSWWFSNSGEGSSIGVIRTYYVGMVIDPVNTVAETNESNNSNMGSGVDYTSITISNPAG
ncbi:MAG TPA: CARDB domain-containing protein [Crinalium sp.]|jgi:hypothetical protein